MIELSQAGEGLLRQGFAGDTFNTAWYARKLLGPDWAVDYATVLGRDPLSDAMVDFMAGAGIGTDRIGRHPTRAPGMYLISLSNGERSFTYWRDSAAARTLADDDSWLQAAMAGADVVYVSGITFAILPPEGRDRLRNHLSRARGQGTRVVFDPNIRPKLWADAATLCRETEAAAAVSDIVLPSHEDEAHWFGDQNAAATAQRYLALGAGEVIVKNGGDAMVIADADGVRPLPALERVTPVDTTGAGDSFNGGYLAARLTGSTADAAILRGHGVAMRVVGQHGALVPLSDFGLPHAV